MIFAQFARGTYNSARSLYRRFRKRSVFEEIYRQNLWGDRESRSGAGSGQDATTNIRQGLVDLIQRLNIRSIVDAPCGDFYWLSTVDLARHVESYRGVDIVPEMIRENTRRFGDDKISFGTVDLVKEVLPAADLILCRHLLIHLTLADCCRVLRNFKKSGARYLMITNQPQAEKNEEILFTGAYRPVNLFLPPFSFPQPLCSVKDSQGDNDLSEAAVFDLAKVII